jgi:hypothetical protein
MPKGPRGKRRPGDVIVAAMLVAGCSGHYPPQKMIAQCQLEALHTYAGKTELDDEVSSYVQTCMEARGFAWNYQDQICKSTAGSSYRSVTVGMIQCYRRSKF